MLRSIHYAGRRPLRIPGFSVAAALTLALGIGATTSVFSVVNAVLLRPLPYDRPDQILSLSHTLNIPSYPQADQSDATFLYYRQANHVFVNLGAYVAIKIKDNAASGGTSFKPFERM